MYKKTSNLKKRKYDEKLSLIDCQTQYFVDVNFSESEIKLPTLKIKSESEGLLDLKYDKDYDLIREFECKLRLIGK